MIWRGPISRIPQTTEAYHCAKFHACYPSLNNFAPFSWTKAKSSYYKCNLRNSKGDQRKTWKIVNSILSRKPKSCNVDMLKVSNTEITDKSQIADLFNDYFSTIGSNIAKKVPISSLSASPQDFMTFSNSKFSFTTVSESQVKKLIDELDGNKAVGLDNIPAWILKQTSDIIVPHLTYIFNLCLKTGTFVDEWKKAKVTPIYKGGSHSDMNNYRPISVLPLVSKIFEKIVFKQLYSYLSSNDLLLHKQSGFRPGHSTATCLISQINEWLLNIDNGLVNGVLQVDLKKAFDTVDHHILAFKLSALGVHDKALDFFKSYLEGRMQQCAVNNVITSTNYITHGVPQGSVLGPLLFIIYINDLPNCLQHTNASLYADDTQFYTASNDADELDSYLNTDLSLLREWLIANKLSLHPDKTKCIYIGTRQRLATFSSETGIFVNDHEVAPSDHLKSLGIILDENLNWNQHVEHIIKKIKSALGALRRAKPFVTKETLIQIYNALIVPHFDYCAEVWGDLNKGLSEKLQKMQNRAARIISGANYEIRSADILKSLEWHPLHIRRDLGMACMMFRCFNNQAPTYLTNLFDRLSTFTCHNLRSTASNFHIKGFNTEYGKRSITYRGAKLWNSLSHDAKSKRTINSFRKAALKDIISLNESRN